MRRPALSILPLGAPPALLFGLSVAGTAARPPALPGAPDLDPSDLVFGAALFCFALVGSVVVSRRPENRTGRAFYGFGALGVVMVAADEYAVHGLLLHGVRWPLAGEAAWLASWIWGPMIALLPPLLLTFPTGRLPSRRWGWILAVDTVAAALTVGAGISVWGMRGTALIGGWDDLAGAGLARGLEQAAGAIWLPCLAASAVALVVRFRRSRGAERQQIKLLAYAASLTAVAVPLQGIVGQGRNPVLGLLSAASLLGIPVAAGVAILRHRLFDIDRLINRTVVYGFLTAVLGGGYLGGVVLLQALLRPLTPGSDLAVVGSTLAVAALFAPLRRRVQAFVDRRFYRRRYDAARTLESFGRRLRDEVDLGALRTELGEMVGRTMQPAHVSVWLREGGRTA